MDFFEVLVGDVGVDLGGGDVGVAEHGLDGTDVGAVHEQVGGEAMAKSMRRDVLGNAGCVGVFLDDAFDRARSEAAEITRSIDGLEIFAIIKEKGDKRVGADGEVIADPVGGGFGDENRAVFAAFAADDKFAAL